MSVVTISAIKADVGGLRRPQGRPSAAARRRPRAASGRRSGTGMLVDGRVESCGDDINLVMTHHHGADAEPVHRLRVGHVRGDDRRRQGAAAVRRRAGPAGRRVLRATSAARAPASAEMEIVERPSEPIVVFTADKTAAGAWNLPLYKMFCGPIQHGRAGHRPESCTRGSAFEVHDVIGAPAIELRTAPEEIYDLLVFIGAPARYVIKRVLRRRLDQIGGVTSTTRCR